MYRERKVSAYEILFGLYKVAMSLTETVVSLKLQSGKKFDEILIKHTECTLAEFLDETLKELEVFISETRQVLRGVVYLLIKLHPRTGSSQRVSRPWWRGAGDLQLDPSLAPDWHLKLLSLRA